MKEEQNATLDEPSVLGQTNAETVLAGAAFAVVGAGLGWLVKLAAKWLVSLPWAPMQGPAKLVTSLPEPGLTIGIASLGALIGLGLVLYGRFEDLSVTVAGDSVTLTRKGESWQVPGSGIALVFLDDKQFVLLGHDGGELAREKCDVDTKRVAAAVQGHGYAWAEKDPHKDEFRRWVSGMAGISEGANALLKARSVVLEKGSDLEQLRELRAELGKLGVVVRDDKKKQYFRMSNASS
ncbi:hypothetical protein ACH4SP_21080 [Streptomyces sp. NPDC021093]|uniref:YqeB family protein n=1 Tax=Streptomyces sp. NPDC021093 TaxID=3365112 RepID=UPI0037B49A31